MIRSTSGPQQDQEHRCYLVQCGQEPLLYPRVQFSPPCWRYPSDFLLQFKPTCVKNVYGLRLEGIITSSTIDRQPELRSSPFLSGRDSRSHSASDIQMAPINTVLEKEPSQSTTPQADWYIPEITCGDERRRRVSSGSLYSKQEFMAAPLLQKPVSRPVSIKPPRHGEKTQTEQESIGQKHAKLEEKCENVLSSSSFAYLAPQALTGFIFVPAPRSVSPAPVSSDRPSLTRVVDAKPFPASVKSSNDKSVASSVLPVGAAPVETAGLSKINKMPMLRGMWHPDNLPK